MFCFIPDPAQRTTQVNTDALWWLQPPPTASTVPDSAAVPVSAASTIDSVAMSSDNMFPVIKMWSPAARAAQVVRQSLNALPSDQAALNVHEFSPQSPLAYMGDLRAAHLTIDDTMTSAEKPRVISPSAKRAAASPLANRPPWRPTGIIPTPVAPPYPSAQATHNPMFSPAVEAEATKSPGRARIQLKPGPDASLAHALVASIQSRSPNRVRPYHLVCGDMLLTRAIDVFCRTACLRACVRVCLSVCVCM
jgi:hypothetical protein